MKEFMDLTYTDYLNNEYSGKLFGCMTSCSNSPSEATHCLNSMMYWAQMHDMVHLPFINDKKQPVEGVIYYNDCEINDDTEIGQILTDYAQCLCEYLMVGIEEEY